MIPFGYPEDFDRFKNSLFNFWTPLEIQMGSDRSQYENSSPILQHIVKTNLANLTTSDVEIMDNVALGTQNAMVNLGLAQAPETRMMLNVMAFQEALHTFSYQHIIESLGMSLEEQEKFYSLWKTQPAMQSKVEFAYEHTQRLAEPDVTLEEFLLGTIFYSLVYEGGWFMTGFNVNWALTHFYIGHDHRPLMNGTSEQLQYIFRDETQHVAFGTDIIKRAMVGVQKDILQKRLNPILFRAYDLEKAYAEYLFSNPILGYGIKDHMAFFARMVNRRIADIGLTPVYHVDEEDGHCKWRDTVAGVINTEKNFFEKRVLEYQVGGLTWED
jgi:ribonucleoside-diphosphate reductase beta chain